MKSAVPLCPSALLILSVRVALSIALGLIATCASAATEITIEELSDIQFGQIPPTAGTQTRTATFCVALDENGRYLVTGVGSGAGGAFTLQNSSSYSVAGLSYQVFINDRGRGLGRRLSPSVPLVGLRGKRMRPNGRCPRPPARVSVRITAAQLATARPGRYRGTLNLLVVPE